MPFTHLNTRCPGPLNRRLWMSLGGLSLGALATGIQPTLGGLLAAEGHTSVDREFSVILFWANGGPSHLDLFDLKPGAPAEYRGPFQPIQTNVPGIEITELLPQLSRLADKFSLIRSLHHERNEHSGGTHRFLTGYPSRAANLNDAEFPELGSVVAHELRGRGGEVPSFVANTKFYGGGPAYLGPAFGPYMPSPNPRSSTGDNQYDPIPIFKEGIGNDDLAISPEGVVSLSRRMNLLAQLDALPRAVDAAGEMQALDSFQKRAATMLASPRTRQAFDLTQEDSRTLQRYGDTHFGKSLLTCRRLVEAGVRFVQCQANYRLRPETGVTSNWDDHSVNSHIFDSYREKLPSFDQSVSALVEDLYLRGLDRHVLFVFCGEFGRTPLIRNQDKSGRPGRDHWSKAMSVLLAGGGLQMGQVIGKTSAKAEEPVERRMDSNCLLATIYRRFGIDTRRHLHDQLGRPLAILPAGEPIAELL
ncbi:hypothetical protein ETAA8_30600 [Anatilimnocola aggregata]|uniref:DUF1501 domain-containing protein n=1 Tax=Anatilimnocola aggregata TaxID=2528021 RepID=A0A517YCL3_9BACT|nr:DUF1501 domain-containing protein [Anatilimnocola aggregata]QDU27968.1 hypothetical protein ETAA8_30600 [Anatilimnocola aggregata]